MRNRSVAALLAFFVGGFGVHKFYLGENTTGILYLLFFWTLIPGLLALFDLVGLLLMTDGAFNLKYNPGYLENSTSVHSLGSSQDKVATLAQLKQLYDTGIITAEEYEKKRRKYLDSL
jgi:TM2 domain-containing membrane protein YozV